MKKGILLVIEGTDCSGKQTQCKLLIRRLNQEGYKSDMISFPTYGTPAGDIVGDCCLGRNNRINTGSWFKNFSQTDPYIASLYYAANRRENLQLINQKLKNLDLLAFDRYVQSNMGHQCGKLRNPIERAKLRDNIERLEYEILEMPIPDYIIFLYMPFAVTSKLLDKSKEIPDSHESDKHHLINSEEAYLELSNFYKWNRIDCSFNGENPRSPEDIHEDVYAYVKKFFLQNNQKDF